MCDILQGNIFLRNRCASRHITSRPHIVIKRDGDGNVALFLQVDIA